MLIKGKIKAKAMIKMLDDKMEVFVFRNLKLFCDIKFIIKLENCYWLLSGSGKAAFPGAFSPAAQAPLTNSPILLREITVAARRLLA